jgi:hypothetical protein
LKPRGARHIKQQAQIIKTQGAGSIKTGRRHQNLEAQASKHRAQASKHQAQASKHRAQASKHQAQASKHQAQYLGALRREWKNGLGGISSGKLEPRETPREVALVVCARRSRGAAPFRPA